MNIWNKVLLVLITLTGIGFMILASNRYVLQKDWAEKIQKLETKLAQAQTDVKTLAQEIYGDPLKKGLDWDSLSLVAQKERVRSLVRGAVWVGCESQTIAEKDNKVSTSFVLPTQYNYAGLRPSGLVYIFDSGAPFVATGVPVIEVPGDNQPAGENANADATTDGTEPVAEEQQVAATTENMNPESGDTEEAEPAIATAPARFLGIFKIEKVNRNEISLASVTNMTKDEIADLDQSVKGKNSWIIYPDRLPIDSPADIKVMNESNPEFLAMLTPAEQEFLAKDEFAPGEALVIARGDMDANRVDKRLPLDFNYLLEEGFTQRDTLNATIARKEMCLADINHVLVQQLLMIGNDIPESAKPLVDMAAYDRAKADFKQSSMTVKKTDLAAALDSMKKQCEIVHDKLELVENTLAEMRAEIASLLNKNRDLAVGIARSQFQAVQNIMGLSAQSEPTTDTGIAHSNDLAGL